MSEEFEMVDLQVTYEGEQDSVFDNKVERALSQLDYELVASGYNFRTKIRDIQFSQK